MQINPNEGVKPISDFRKDAAGILATLKTKQEPILLTQRGHAVAVLLDVATYQHLEYAAHLRSSYQRGLEDLKKGRAYSHNDVIYSLKKRIA